MGRTVGGGLRSRLLVGVAAAAMAAPVANRALAADPGGAKFSPYVEAGGMVGTHSFGDVDIFIPVWQDQTSILFGDLRGTFSAQPTEEGNFGLGYRTQVSPEWILGGYGYFDIANSPNNNLFYQITLGVELKSVDWDFRLNGYIPINPDGGSVTKNGNANIKISGNTIQMTTESRDEKALYGFDGEVGWRVPVFPADGDFDLRVYAGGYYFTNGDVDTIAGPRGRIEARLYDIDFLGLQSRLTAQGVIQWDAPRGTQGWGGLELRIPLGAITGSPGPKLNPLDRRMVDRVVRDIDIVTEKTTPKKTSEDVIVDELTVSTHTIVFANSNGAGSGAQGSPIDLNQAPSRGQTLGSNAIILADGGNGNIAISNPLQLSNGQALIGGGSIVPLTGAKTGKTVDFKFSGSRPTLVGTNPNENVVDMATGSGPTLLTQNEVWGVNITGQFSNGIFGQNMERAIVKHSNIDAGGSIDGEAGIYIAQYGDGTQKSSFVHIANNTVSNSPDDGIDVGNSFSDGASHTQTVIISYNTVVANLHDGIDQRNVLSGTGTTFTQGLAINNNVATANGVAGIETRNFVSSGAVLVQALQIDPNTVAYNAYAGIRVGNFAFSGGVITQGVVIADNTVKHNGIAAFTVRLINGLNDGGIVLDNNASNGSITQAVAIDGNSVAFNGAKEPVIIGVQPLAPPFFPGFGNGISVYNRAVSNASILQVGEISGNQIDHNSQNGIGLANEFTSGSVITQQLTIAGNSITFNHSDGIFNKNFGFLGTLDQTLSIDNAVISHNGESGIFVTNGATSSNLNQNITVDPSTITSHYEGFGIAIISRQLGGTTVQNIAVLDNTIADSGFEGVLVATNGSSNASITQSVTISGNSISDSGSHGVEVTAGGEDGVHVVQNTTITGNAIDHSGRAGIAVFAYASSRSVEQSGSLTQNVLISGNSVDHSSSSGIYVSFHAVSLGDAMHTVTVANNIVTNSREDGIKVIAGFSSVANPVASTISVTGNQVSNVSRYAGIFVGVALSSASVVQSVVIDGNSVAHAHSAGIYLSTFVAHDSTLTQTAQINNNAVYDVHDGLSVAGIFVSNFVSGDSTMSQSLTIAGNQIATLNAAPLLGNVAIGIGVNNFVGSNATLNQTAAIDNNTVSDLHGQFVVGIGVYNGLSGLGASLSQVLTIDPNTITGLHGITGNGKGYAVGIGVFTRVDYHGVATQTVTIADNVISHVSAGAVIDNFVRDRATGILMANTVGSNSTLSQTAFIDSNTISELRGASAAGIVVYSEVSGGGAFMTQALTIDPNTITGLHGTTNILGDGYALGIGVFTRVVSGGFASQTVAITDNSISNINGDFVAHGVYVVSHESDGTLLGSLDIVDNAVSGISGGAFAGGIGVFNRDASFGTFSQSVDIAGNAVSGVSAFFAAGIDVENRATSSTMSQTVSISGNFVSYVVGGEFADGIEVDSRAGSNGVINQNVAIANNTVTYTGNGIEVFTDAYGSGAGISQAITITGNAISNNFGAGILIGAQASSNATLTQGGTIASNSVTLNGFDGIAFRATAEDGFPATTNQTFDLTNNTVSNNGRHGIYLYASGAGATQVVTLTTSAPGNVITNNGGWGVALKNSTTNLHQTFAAHSTQIGGTGPNILSPNNLGAYHLSGVGTQVFTKN